MKRRDFIHLSSVLGASVSSFLLSCGSNKNSKEIAFELEEKSILELQRMMVSGNVTSEAITHSF